MADGERETVDVGAIDDDGNSALHLAAASGLCKCVEILVSQGAPLFVENKLGTINIQTVFALYFDRCMLGAREVFCVSALINMRRNHCKNGSCFMQSSVHKSSYVCFNLCSSVTTFTGQTPCDCAELHHHNAIAVFLESKMVFSQMDLSSPSSAANNNNNGGTSTTTATTTPTSGNNNNSRGGGGSETTTTEKESKELKAGDSVSTDSSDPNDVMSDAYSGLRAQVRKSTEVSIDTVREEFWLATHLHVKREARPGNDASGLCLCVY